MVKNILLYFRLSCAVFSVQTLRNPVSLLLIYNLVMKLKHYVISEHA